MLRASIYFLLLSSLAVSCVSAGKFKALQAHSQKTDSLYSWSERTLKTCQDANSDLNLQKTTLQGKLNSQTLELNASKENITMLRKQLQDLSTLSSAQAESLKKSIDNIGAKDSYIQDLHAAVVHRDSINMAVLMNLKAYMGGFGDSIVRIKLERGTVYVDIADSLLFTDSSAYALKTKARSIAGRLARVFNDVPEASFTVEGHSDSLSTTLDSTVDNWDISVKRATAITRLLQNDYHIAASRMIASGNIQDPVPFTRIVIIPDMEKIFAVLERK